MFAAIQGVSLLICVITLLIIMRRQQVRINELESRVETLERR